MKKNLLIITIIFTLFFTCKNVYAFDINNYRYRDLCGNYEVSGFHADGYIDKVACFDNYNKAKEFMISNGAADLAIMTRVNGSVKIVDANVALLDLSVNPTTLTYFYENSELTGRQYTYMDTGSLYGGVDGALLDSSWSNTYGKWTAKVRIGNFTGWIPSEAYEVVPITWVHSLSSYTITNESIKHNYVNKIQDYYSGSRGSYIGPKPEMLNTGNYYSYDGHYFYNDLETMLRDYRKGNYNNSINKDNAYYNYYMYLSNHTKTSYSSINIDEYIRNNMGYKKDVYGHKKSDGTSRLYGQGTFFYYAQEKYGVNAILSLSLSRNETANGTSSLSINKNNGFGLNAVDSNPTQAANWYASFSSSILGYANKWITYGFASADDWRYFGPQFGDKWIGMNVKYASDTYWSEKMASNYYNMDKALGLQDYNYYQLGVLKNSADAYRSPSNHTVVYKYPEAEDAVVIIGEETHNGTKYYKVMSDYNLDANGNRLYSGDYNWNSAVYVKASDIKKINKGKNGYISPNSVYEYEDANYRYDLYDQNNKLNLRVAQTLKNTPYYYDSTLTQQTGSTLLKDRYIVVYTVAYKNNQPVAYLVTSDYYYDQKHWISADSIKFVDIPYGTVTVDTNDNQYTWVNYNTEDAYYSKISGLYTYSHVPVLEKKQVGNDLWYKVPVSLTTNDNVYGYTLSKYSNYIKIELSSPIVENILPVINIEDKELYVNEEFDALKDVTANDNEDGDLTNKIIITENTVNNKVAGTYKVTYKVVDSSNGETTKTIKVTVLENNAPVINASNRTLYVGDKFNELENVTATDNEDGDLTHKIIVLENTVNTNAQGTYKVSYQVTDSRNKTTTKDITVTIKEKVEDPIDDEDIDIDELLEHKLDGEFYLDNLKWDNNTKKFIISGYQIIMDIDNTNKENVLVLFNKNTEEVYIIEINNWKDNVPFNIGYKDAWFKGEIDFTEIPNGDYDLYMMSYVDDYYTINLVDNYFNQDIDRRGEDNSHGYNFKVQQKSKAKEITLNVRDELYTISESPTSRNMVNGYEDIKFKNNKLYMYGYSYDYEGIYSDELLVNRKLIIENTSNYSQKVYDLGAKKGPFLIETQDKKDKSYAWYEKEIDISELEKGNYSIYIYTKTSNAENFDELIDIFRSVNDTMTINNKTYTIKFNKDRNKRIEITVK